MARRLSDNFWDIELECRHCGRLIIESDLLDALEELRAESGGKRVLVHSGYRCFAHNAAIGGSRRSQHLTGRAADITVLDHTVDEMLELAESVEAFRSGGIGGYPDRGFIHVDIRGKRARWTG